MSRTPISLILVVQLVLSSVGFTATRMICPMSESASVMKECPGCETPDEGTCCKKIVERKVLDSEFDRGMTFLVSAGERHSPLLATTDWSALINSEITVRPSSNFDTRPIHSARDKCVQTTVILI